MLRIIKALFAAIQILRALLDADGNTVCYFQIRQYGVPQTVVLLGVGREAWRISDFAIAYNLERGWHQGISE